VDVRPDAVEVAITDTGHGLEPQEVERALRPFYSTKPLGTGLGLPLVARIISAHGGGLAIESRPGRGTTVRITLPVLPPHAGKGAQHG
jgi:signal transduction histidine kinase